jgi:hypothetical protein
MLTPHLKKSACHQPAKQHQLAPACDPSLNHARQELGIDPTPEAEAPRE